MERKRTWIIALAIGWLCWALSDAHSAEQHPAVVKVYVGEGWQGSGVWTQVDRTRCVVLTAAHVLAHKGDCSIVWLDGRERPANRVGYDTLTDVGVLLPENPPCVAPLPLAYSDQLPGWGAQVAFYGFGGNRYRKVSCSCLGYVSMVQARHWDHLICSVPSIDGDSGGPIVFRGRVAGTIYGHPNQRCQGPNAAQIRAFIERLKKPKRVRTQAAPVGLERRS